MDFLIDEQTPPGPPPEDHAGAPPWRILIVDDAQDVHDATHFALRGFTFENRQVELLHALTAGQARDILSREPDIAVAVIDVVMESEQAGIELIDWMRNTLGNYVTRIILRTGQPGYAPESDVILQHEIDGYKEKSEMTRTRLLTMLVTSLRGYRQIRDLENHEAGLRKLVDSLGELLKNQDMDGFSERLIAQLVGLLGTQPSGALCVVDQQGVDGEPPTVQDCTVLTALGDYASHTGTPARTLPDAAAVDILGRCLAQREPVIEDGHAAIRLETSGDLCGVLIVRLSPDAAGPANATELLRLFAINAGVGYQNARLFEHVRNLAYHDPNTGLPNFTAFAEIFDAYCAEWPDTPAAVVLFDVQRYRVIEHGIGPEHALKVLQAAGKRLQDGIADAPVVAHRRGDEFALMMVGDQIDRPEELVERIEKLFETALRIGEVVFTLRPRIALASREDPSDDAAMLARRAGVALDELRRSGSGGGRYIVYNERMSAAAYERLRIATMLSGDSAKELTHVYTQPIVDTMTEEVVAGEALLRFIQPDGTILHTGNAVAAAEASGLILDLGRWALERGMYQHREVIDSGLSVRLNINLSPAQIQANQIKRDFIAAFEASGFDPAYLNVEVTEGLFMDGDAHSVSFLQWLRDKGARILIDDFGTGYSSLSYLRKLPVDGLKIDRSFVMEMVENADCSAVVGSIVGVGKALGLELTAEGVETIAQRDALRDMGVEKLQGFLYAKALPASAFLAYAGGTPTRR